MLLNKAIKTAIVSTVKADALGVDEAANLSLKNKLGDMRDALQACEQVIENPSLSDVLPGGGALKGLKALISKAGKAEAYVNSLAKP